MATANIRVTLDNKIQSLQIQEVYRSLQTQVEGLSTAEAEQRLLRYSANRIREIKGKPLILKFLANFSHLMALLLWFGGIAAFIGQLPEIGIAIWMVNLINGLFSFWQEFKAEKATEALRKLLPQYVRVIRDNQEQRILVEALVPGDIILLTEGEHISADARLVRADELRTDQSTLTGEAHPVRKSSDAVLQSNLSRSELANLVFAGTSVTAGTGKAVVFATGMNSEFGKIAHLTQSMSEEISPLQKEIEVTTKLITLIAVGTGLLFFVLAILLTGMSYAESFIFGLGMIVAFVPEGLLPTITLSLAMGVQRMVKRHALVKRLSAVETLGCTTVICTDKTGTLTQNEMTVRELWVTGRRLSLTGIGYAPEGEILESGEAIPKPLSGVLRQLLIAAAQCNDSRLLPPNHESGRWTVLGDPTEAALRVAAIKGGLDLEDESQCRPRQREIPFDSRRKRMTTIHQEENKLIAYTKGAPKEVLAYCKWLLKDGESETLDSAIREQILAVNDDFARSGLRVLAIAQRELSNEHRRSKDYSPENIECDLTFIGLMAMMDPPRLEVAEAVAKCQRAGIRIVMITGDYGLTAESIARRIGIIRSENTRIVTGVELDEMSDEALKDALKVEILFARVAPEHKLRVVQALQEQGQIVAVTGDGVNDAPALKKADIGVAMGIAGTDVAKEAADLILSDDNFASIVNAIEEGRAVYANIKKFITYIFTSNAPEAIPFVAFVFSQARIPLALNIMQILAIDLGTDMIPALALGKELPEPGIMDKAPRNLKEHLITIPLLLRAYLWLGLIQGLAAMLAFYFMYWTNGYTNQWQDLPSSGDLYRAATTMTLAAVVATQIGNVFAQRTERSSVFKLGLFSNPMIWLGIVLEVALILLITYLPVLQTVFGTAALAPQYWLFLLALTPCLLLADELRKALLRYHERRR